MKCDDVWPILETGNVWQRWRARRHLRQCPSCANAASKLVLFKRILAETESVSPDLRMRWTAATAVDSAATLPVARKRSRLAIGAAAAAMIIVAVAFWQKSVPKANRPAPDIVGARPGGPNRTGPNREAKPEPGLPPTVVVVASPVRVKRVDVASELLRLQSELAQSESEIRKLADQAKLRRASAQLDLLLAKYGRN